MANSIASATVVYGLRPASQATFVGVVAFVLLLAECKARASTGI